MTPKRRAAAWIVAFALTAMGGAGRLAPVAGAGVPDDDRAILHVLNRIGFGPRPGDLERGRALGVQKYIDQQPPPNRIADSGMSARVADLSTLHMSSRDIAQQFEVPLLEARRAQKNA